jgi:hypothetical protein
MKDPMNTCHHCGVLAESMEDLWVNHARCAERMTLIRAECEHAARALDENGMRAASARIRTLPTRLAAMPGPEATLAAVVAWLEVNQPDVFRRGLWDAVEAARSQSVDVRPCL